MRIDVLANDDPSLLAWSARLIWPSGVSPGQMLVDFVPGARFTGDPTPMRYVARDPLENDRLASITITYRGEPMTPPITTGSTTASSRSAPTDTDATAQPTGDGLPVTGSDSTRAQGEFALVVGGILLVIGARRQAPDS